MQAAHDLRARLEYLASNLWWTWRSDVQRLFRGLDPDLWERCGHAPRAFLDELGDEELESRAAAHGLDGRIHAAARRLEGYLGSTDTWGRRNVGCLHVEPVAYFSAEFGLHESLPLYSGGLGVLAGDHLKSASDLDVPLVGVGILYNQGYFIQRLDEHGWQGEEFHAADVDRWPVRPLEDGAGKPLEVRVPANGEEHAARVFRAEVGRTRLLLLDTDLEGNADSFRDVTHRLYWGDQESRIRQELVLGIGGLRALRAAGVQPGVFHLNEGHSAFALLEAIRMEMEENGLGFEEARHRVAKRSVFTTHTPVAAGHDRFPPEMIEHHLGWMREALGLDEKSFLGLGRENPEDAHETFCMTVLALKLADRANGVSSLHGDVSRTMWKTLWPTLPPTEIPIGHVTNGVHVGTWMAPEWRRVFERHAGPDWERALGEESFADEGPSPVSAGEIWETRNVLKARLVAFCRDRHARQNMRRGTDEAAARRRAEGLLDPNVLTIGFARRFATYKRATLLLRDRARFQRLLHHPSQPIQFVFAGKAHPRDDAGKALIQEIARLVEDPSCGGRVVFLENYDMEVGRMLTQGVDVWLNNPKRFEEASGTSGMKVVLNGGLNASIRDGWWAEGFDGRNGFGILSPGPHTDQELQDARDAEALYRTLENEVAPLFYDRDQSGLPLGWIRRIRWAFRTLARRYSSDRMVEDYARKAYLPAALGDTVRMPF